MEFESAQQATSLLLYHYFFCQNVGLSKIDAFCRVMRGIAAAKGWLPELSKT